MERLVNELTQKDETKALKAAQKIIDGAHKEAFELLCRKSEYLYDFVKNNIRKRLKKAVNKDNYENIKSFFKLYNEEYADTFIESIARFANEDLSDEMYELLEKGTSDEKKYAAKYFFYIPDTIAQDKLEEYAFLDDTELAVNAAQALGAMNAKNAYDNALRTLNSDDDFEVMKAVRFLSAYNDKNAVPYLLNILDKTTLAENIAAEIPYLMSVPDMLETQDLSLTLTCFDYILTGLGEILPLSQIFDFEIFEVIQYIIQKAKTEPSSQLAAVLLRAAEKFSTLLSNDEYIFDETKDTKDEIKAIDNLLSSQGEDFWKQQRILTAKELKESKPRATAALEIIQALKINEAKSELLDFINTQKNEQMLVLAMGAAKTLEITSQIESNDLYGKISDSTAKAIVMSYFAS